MKKFFLLILLLAAIFGFIFIKDYYKTWSYINGSADILYFENSEEYELAKAVQKGKIKDIKKICYENPSFIQRSYNEKYFSVLHFACKIKMKKSIKTLLEVGMNPNVMTSANYTPLMCLFRWEFEFKINEHLFLQKNRRDITELLIDYGADCNIQYNDKYVLVPTYYGLTNYSNVTALMLASSLGATDCVELMMQRGRADISLRADGRSSAAEYALFNNKIKTAHTLICMYHARIADSVIIDTVLIKKTEIKPVFFLRGIVYPLKSKEYKLKKEIIKELKNQGVDYYSEPVPDDIRDKIIKLYPDTWEEYIKVY